MVIRLFEVQGGEEMVWISWGFMVLDVALLRYWSLA